MENLDLIDWKMLGFAGLWIMGLAVILAVLGFADYHAKASGTRFREQLRKASHQVWVNFGLVLFCLGLLGSAKAWWESVLWGLLASSFIVFGIRSFREWRKGQEDED